METDFLASGSHFLPMSQIFLKRRPSPCSVETHFLVQKKRYCLFREYFPATGNHYLNKEKPSTFLIFLSMEVFFPSSINVFLNNSPFLLVKTNFLFSWSSFILFRDFFACGNREIQFSKKNLIPALKTDFLAPRNHFFFHF